VFWGSSEGFKESHINWQGIFLKILIFFGEKRKYHGMLLLREKKAALKSTSDRRTSRFGARKSRMKLKCALGVISFLIVC